MTDFDKIFDFNCQCCEYPYGHSGRHMKTNGQLMCIECSILYDSQDKYFDPSKYYTRCDCCDNICLLYTRTVKDYPLCENCFKKYGDDPPDEEDLDDNIVRQKIPEPPNPN